MAPPKLARALKQDSTLRSFVQRGTRALSSPDADLIAEGERSKVAASLDLDAATRVELPEAHRWDYLISVHATDAIVGLEPHTAKDSEIKVVIEKRRRARDFLRNHLRSGRSVSRW